MFKLAKLVLVFGAGFGIWYFLTHFQVLGLEALRVQPRDPTSAGAANSLSTVTTVASPTGKQSIRIGAANFGPLDPAKLCRQHVVGRIAQIIRQYDILAIQGVQAPDRSSLVRLVELASGNDRHFDFAVAPEVGRESVKQYNAFLFDRDTIDIDRRTVAWVDNRGGQFSQPPLVGAFRARGPAAGESFTFTLINAHISTERTEKELEVLAKIFRAVRHDGRGEDDVILLGTLGTDDEHLGPLASVPHVKCAISGTPTTTRRRGAHLVDNILFNRRATSEYTDRSGVIDLERQFCLTPQEATEIADHLPIWAEFSIYEDGQPGYVAGKP